MADDEKKTDEKSINDIPKEVLDQLPDSVKAELGVETKKGKEVVFTTEEAKNMTDAMKRMSAGFEKIGLTLIGRMGEFATTLERVMMIVARIEKVENLVAEMKYFMKGLQKSLNNLENSVNNITKLDFSSELAEMKKLLGNVPQGLAVAQGTAPQTPTEQPQTTSQPTVETVTSSQKSPDEVALESAIEELGGADQEAKEVKQLKTPLDELMANPQGEGIELAKKALECITQYVKEGIKSIEVAEELDKCKKFISEKYKWSPTLYDLGKFARQYKSKKDALITQKDISTIEYEVKKWIQKL
ncbi:MAG: hypothetical protein ACTSVY_03305 [Candidatus Helarchaeota archaeon]